MGGYFTKCSGTPPEVNITIGGVQLAIHPEDLLPQGPDYSYGDGTNCATGIQPVDQGPYTLGATFLHSVLAVFDIGASELRFTQRVRY